MTRNDPHQRVNALRKPPPGGVNVSHELRRLMPRDRLLIDLLGQHQVFTTEQVSALAFDHVHTARNRLVLLHQRGILARFRDGVRPGSEQWRWTLDLIGAAYLAARQDQPTPRLSTIRSKTDRLAASPRLAHLIGVNGLFVDLYAHARHTPGAHLKAWWSETACRQVTGDLVRPDGFGLWIEADQRVSFWLEHDTGTEPTHRILSKLDSYAALRRETSRNDAVLIRLHTPGREISLHRHLSTHPAVTGGLLVATSTTDHHPAAPSWWPAGHARRYRLTDLPTLTTE